ncbi:MAG TPA: hypothetical protein VJ783_06270 [Pirellulales bacterium]|nr:hypothetical protein [Pirellulales bacterium]
MTRVSILLEPGDGGAVRYRAVAGEQQSVGNTAGEALDALSAQLPADQKGTLVVVQNLQADEFFTKQKRARLEELMTRWRAARDANLALPATEQAELERLVRDEVAAAGRRAAVMNNELEQ